QRGGGVDLLHGGREHADDRVERVRRADSAGADDDAQRDGGGERDGQQRRGHRDVYDPAAAGGDADVQSGAWDVHLIGERDDCGQHGGGDYLLHDGREHRSEERRGGKEGGAGEADDHGTGEGAGERDGEQRSGERDVVYAGA